MADSDETPAFSGGFTFGGEAEPQDDSQEESEAESDHDDDAPPEPVNFARGRRITVSAQVYDATTEAELFTPVVHDKSTEDVAILKEVCLAHSYVGYRGHSFTRHTFYPTLPSSRSWEHTTYSSIWTTESWRLLCRT